MSNEKKHEEEIGRKLVTDIMKLNVEVCREDNFENVDYKHDLLGLVYNSQKELAKHYDTPVEPQPTVEDWVKSSKTSEFYLVTKDDDGFYEGINKDAATVTFDHHEVRAGRFTKHEFSEPDLKLLDTEDVKYELRSIHLQNKECCYYVQVTDSNKEGYYTIQPSYTVHEAIKSAFNTTVEHEHFKRNVLKGMVTK